jgi:hypothetical protein
MNGNSKEISYEVMKNGCWKCTSHYDNKGYPKFQNNGKTIRIAKYLYEREFGEVPEGFVLRHKCDNPKCINPSHLEVGTQRDNMQDMVERGHSTKGSKNPMSKLSEDDVKTILIRIKKGEFAEKIAEEYKVSKMTIGCIAGRITWRHIK